MVVCSYAQHGTVSAGMAVALHHALPSARLSRRALRTPRARSVPAFRALAQVHRLLCSFCVKVTRLAATLCLGKPFAEQAEA